MKKKVLWQAACALIVAISGVAIAFAFRYHAFTCLIGADRFRESNRPVIQVCPELGKRSSVIVVLYTPPRETCVLHGEDADELVNLILQSVVLERCRPSESVKAVSLGEITIRTGDDMSVQYFISTLSDGVCYLSTQDRILKLGGYPEVETWLREVVTKQKLKKG
jgi:hypothetical protein